MRVLLYYLIATTITFAAEILARPRSVAPWRRKPTSLGVHVAAVTAVFVLMLSLSARPVFSGLVCVALTALIALINNAKHESLKEPFVFTDLSLFSQLFHHPRLYLPFLSADKVAAIVVGACIFLTAFFFDTALLVVSHVELGIVALICVGAAIVLSSRLPLTLEVASDYVATGFIAGFIAYLCNGLRLSTFRALHYAFATGPFSRQASPSARPDVVVIQSESFFDARRLGAEIRQPILKNFDAACASSVQYGRLDVPAWGANTMRTEFAVLSGLSNEALGYARFYPYAFLRRPCLSLAAWFKRAGYRTTAIHPYHADFFGRDRAFSLMHFERFVDVKHFADAPRAGPYVADSAVADAIIRELDAASGGPSLVMAITMENHGPLHLERVVKGEAMQYHSLGDDARWSDLTAYLRHIKNADAMIGQLMHALSHRERETLVCFYGDHVPAIPRVFEALGKPLRKSDYFIWRSHGEGPSQRADITASQLGVALIDYMEVCQPAASLI